MFFIKELNSELNTQKDSIRAKLFTWLCMQMFDCITVIFYYCICVS